MIYEWRCTKCGKTREVHRAVADRDIDPDGKRDGKQAIIGEMSVGYAEEAGCASIPGYEHIWERPILPATVPWEQLRDKGVFERLERYT